MFSHSQLLHRVVDYDYLVPVLGNLRQVKALADVDQVEDVLLETRAAKPNTRLQTQNCKNNWANPRMELTWRNLGPILESLPIAWATSDTSAPVASHTADMLLMLEIRWARNALAASLLSSLDLNRIRNDLFSLG